MAEASLVLKIMTHNDLIKELEKRIGYEFRDRSLIKSALSHSSYTNELQINRIQDYQRLEFLGDAVLELLVSDYLYRNYPEMKEGEMTRVRSSLVCEPALAECARKLDIPSCIMMGRGEDAQGSRYHDSIASDVFESLIGAIYMDAGMERAREFIDKYCLKFQSGRRIYEDSKSILQSRIQKEGSTLEYAIVDESGPDHAKIYTAAVYIDGREVSRCPGHSKKDAEQNAAHMALNTWKSPDGSSGGKH